MRGRHDPQVTMLAFIDLETRVPPDHSLRLTLGNFMRRLVLPEDMKHWTLTSLQTRLIKTGGRLVRHAKRLVFQLAEVLVTREMLTGILERISWLRLAPG